MGEPQVRRARCAELPVVWVEPVTPAARPSLALWLTHLGGSKEQTIPVLAELAAAGQVAVSFDPWRHGERGAGEEPRELLAAVLGDFRRRMWPILGQTALDCLRVIDWALAEVAPGAGVVAGGVSMGGDISVALAGIDPRVGRVAAVVATPDWTRPGMRALADPEKVVDQGSPDAYARWFYDQLDPMTHLHRYRDRPAIAFECAGDDRHVPADGAVRFRDALVAWQQPGAGERVRVTVHPGTVHLDAVNDSILVRHALDWLTEASAATT